MTTEADARPGFVSNNVNPGDPVQEVAVVGFSTLQEALQFVEAGFEAKALKPVFEVRLLRGRSVSFAGASFLVFHHQDPQGKSTLLSRTRCHADLSLAIGSCGYQFLLTINPPVSQRPEPLLR